MEFTTTFWVFYGLYAVVGLFTVWYFALLRGRGYNSTFFLLIVRIFFYGLAWIPFHNNLYFSTICLMYLPLYLDFSEYSGKRASKWFQSCFFARYLKSYFGVDLVRTSNISETQAIIGLHPHGVLPFGSVLNISTDISDFEVLYPSLRKRAIIAASACFYIPIFRDIILAAGVLDCSKYNVVKLLENGYTVSVFPGGTREALYSNPAEDWLDLSRKTGFIRLAMQYNVPVIPSYTFNETDHFNQLEYTYLMKSFPCVHAIRVYFQQLFGVMLPFVTNMIPKSGTKVITVVGTPIRFPHIQEPSDEELKRSMDIYTSELTKLYNTHAKKYSTFERNLKIT